jgi:hypothetical protein
MGTERIAPRRVYETVLLYRRANLDEKDIVAVRRSEVASVLSNGPEACEVELSTGRTIRGIQHRAEEVIVLVFGSGMDFPLLWEDLRTMQKQIDEVR